MKTAQHRDRIEKWLMVRKKHCPDGHDGQEKARGPECDGCWLPHRPCTCTGRHRICVSGRQRELQPGPPFLLPDSTVTFLGLSPLTLPSSNPKERKKGVNLSWERKSKIPAKVLLPLWLPCKATRKALLWQRSESLQVFKGQSDVGKEPRSENFHCLPDLWSQPG